MSSTPLAMQGQFANCSLLVFSLPQVCSRSSSPHLCSVRKSYHVMPYLTSCPPRALTSYTTSSAVLQEFPVLHYLTSCSARAPTSYTTSPVVLQELPHPTQPHRSSYKSSHILHNLTSCPTRAPTSYTTSSAVLQETILPHQLSCKRSHILHRLISCPPSVSTSYTTSSAVLQELPGFVQRKSASVTQRTIVFVNLRTLLCL